MKLIRIVKRIYVKKYGYTRKRQIFFISFPKAGRTWVRNFLNKYYSELYPIALLDGKYTRYSEFHIPQLFFGHMDFYGQSIQDLPSRFRSLEKKKTIFLVRDPRDIFVSYFFQLKHKTGPAGRTKRKDIDWVTITMSELIKDTNYGLENIVNYQNKWFEFFTKSNADYIIVSYEQIKSNPIEMFSKMLRFMGEEELKEDVVEYAVEDSSFEKMKLKEKKKFRNQYELSSVDDSNENSFKVRKGKVGGYAEYFDESDMNYANELFEKTNEKLKEIIKI